LDAVPYQPGHGAGETVGTEGVRRLNESGGVPVADAGEDLVAPGLCPPVRKGGGGRGWKVIGDEQCSGGVAYPVPPLSCASSPLGVSIT